MIKQNAIITGASGFLGSVFIKALLELEFNLILVDKNVKKLKELKKTTSNIHYYKLDVSNSAQINVFYSKIKKKFKKIDVLINSASIDSKPDFSSKKKNFVLENFSEKQWDKEINVNLKSVFLLSRKIGNLMSINKNGIILNIGSDLSIISPRQSIYKNKKFIYKKPITYSVSKHGIVGITKYMAEYWSKYNVRVNCISPGSVKHKQPSSLKKNLVKLIPMSRLLEKKELINVVKFLCSDKSSYITGQNIVVDGGRTVI